jgi:exosortase D (VPLPA-CTERM-specific)
MKADAQTLRHENAGSRHYWNVSWRITALLACSALLAIAIFRDSLAYLVSVWLEAEEYSHGILIPFVTGFLIWQDRNQLASIPFTGSWQGIAVLLIGLFLYFLGELSTLFIIQQYAFVVALLGLVLASVGRRFFREIWIPSFFLLFAIPLPFFLYQGLSSKLQLWSSQLGVYFIRLCDISVYLEGNVIDLGSMQLQVVEACSGLRYLFPLMSLAFICAYFYKVTFWKRLVVFLSSVPITLLMNSFRIGVIGVTVEHFGREAAEGFLHDFEGWIVFMACTGILALEMWALARIGRDPRPLSVVFGVTIPEPLPPDTRLCDRELPAQFWVAGVILLAALGASLSLEHRKEVVPQRAEYREFPLSLAGWTGRRQIMDQQYIDTLKFDDYLLADYVREGARSPVNVYSAYYASQRKGESIHSPRSCIPGGGWEIRAHEVVALNGVVANGNPLAVNRLLIQKGEDRQLVYYWFAQRGRDLTDEYVTKWFLFWDALTMNRTDGALVRLTTYAPKGEDLADADRRLTDFLAAALPELDRYIPN